VPGAVGVELARRRLDWLAAVEQLRSNSARGQRQVETVSSSMVLRGMVATESGSRP
jgi:hypothetical protein